MMMKWMLFVAGRYFMTRRKNRGLAPSILSILGISLGVLTLITVLGVMNGFQLGFIEDILGIRSYHLRIALDETDDPAEAARKVRSIGGVAAVTWFADTQTIIQSRFSKPAVAAVRAISEGAAVEDPSLVEQMGIVDGTFSLGGRRIVLGRELARSLSVSTGETVSLMATAGDSFNLFRPSRIDFTVSGIFASGYFDIDRSMAFIGSSDATSELVLPGSVILGIKLTDRFRDRQAVSALSPLGIASSGEIESWRTYNSSFFGALRTEKLLMMVLVGLIFVVTGANIHHSLRRSVFERTEEIGVLRSLGASPGALRTIFVTDGALIGLIGGIIGLAAGLLVTSNIDAVFVVTERVVNFAISLVNAIASPFSRRASSGFSLFSPAYFYLEEIGARVILREAILVLWFAFSSSTAAAYAASSRVSRIDPSKVLRYE